MRGHEHEDAFIFCPFFPWIILVLRKKLTSRSPHTQVFGRRVDRRAIESEKERERESG